MTGVVIIRAPGVLRMIHRAVLSFCIVNPSEATKLQWMHIGDHLLQGFDVDVLADDDDKTDYIQMTLLFFDTITGPAFCTQDVTWTWDGAKKIWNYTVAPRDISVAEHNSESLDEGLVGYGSLGR